MQKAGFELTHIPGMHPTRLTVRLGSLAANYREALRRAGPATVAPVVKANAYGLGVAPVTHALSEAGADSFFVARLEEGIQIRELLPRARIFVFDGVTPGSAPAFVTHRLTPVLNSLEDIAEWSAAARNDHRELDAALHIDTGMNRCGLSHAELSQLVSRLRQSLAGINLVLIMSHLARADEPDRDMNWEQLAKFKAALALLPPAPASLAASAGIELGRDYLFDIVRPGIGLYGGNPIPSRSNPYHTVASITGHVLQVREIPEGETVGYAATFTASRPCHIAIVATGYADGLVRAMGAKARAAIAGRYVPYAGRISMDLLALDVTDIIETGVTRGTEVELMGDTVTLQEIADAAGTITHEVLASLGPRAHRVYVDA